MITKHFKLVCSDHVTSGELLKVNGNVYEFKTNEGIYLVKKRCNNSVHVHYKGLNEDETLCAIDLMLKMAIDVEIDNFSYTFIWRNYKKTFDNSTELYKYMKNVLKELGNNN